MFNFVEDYCTSNSKKNKDSQSLENPADISNIEEIDETSLNALQGGDQAVHFDNHKLKVNIPVVESGSNSVTNSLAASNSDNELDIEDDDQSETAALLAPGWFYANAADLRVTKIELFSF